MNIHPETRSQPKNVSKLYQNPSHWTLTVSKPFASLACRLIFSKASRFVLPARSPNLNAYAERWVLSVKQECLSKLILFGERSLRRALSEFIDHFHPERNHQGKSNVLLFPADVATRRLHNRAVLCQERLGGLLNYCGAA
jgi:hypothetical protein